VTTTRVLDSLTPREERVLRTCFGIGTNSEHTPEEVGQQFSITRIRQIEAKALRKLKHSARSRMFRSFLDNCLKLNFCREHRRAHGATCGLLFCANHKHRFCLAATRLSGKVVSDFGRFERLNAQPTKR
jgi:hypothetical protein